LKPVRHPLKDTFASVLALLAQVDLPGLGRKGPDELRRLLAISLTLMGIGFLVGVAGHVVRSRTLVAIGVALIFLSTAFFLLAVGQEG
jgi:hypothetical protein